MLWQKEVGEERNQVAETQVLNGETPLFTAAILTR